MDILTRIKNSEFRGDVLKILQSAKINDQIEGAGIVNDIPISSLADTYFSIVCKIVQDIQNYNPKINNNIILHDVVLLCLCKSRKGKKFDKYYDEIIADVEKNINLINKIFIEI
jgi:hypothetical protein